jgi:hypothetical protein
MEKQITSDVKQISYCGLYCGACDKYLNGKCSGCADNTKAAWCKVRSCCIENNYKSCADCREFSNVKDCKKYNNFIARMFGLIFQSDRAACIALIKEKGYEGFAGYMAENKIVALKR